MKNTYIIKSILIFSLGAISIIGYQKVYRNLQINRCLEEEGTWINKHVECELTKENHKLNSKVAYEISITNENVIDFIQSYISEIAGQIVSTYILIMNVDQINDGKKYTIRISTHEIYSNMGDYDYEEKLTDELEPQLIYSNVENQIVLIKSGIEKLNSNLERYEYLLDLTSKKINPSFKTRVPDREGFYELNAPPTQHFDYWEMYECDNEYEIIKRDAWGEILNGKSTPKITFCNHLADNESPPDPLKPPNG